MATYQGKKVTVVGDTQEGQAGFEASVKKVTIKHEDGRVEAVPKTEVTGQ